MGGDQITMSKYKKRMKVLSFPPWVIQIERLALGELTSSLSNNKERAPMTRPII